MSERPQANVEVYASFGAALIGLLGKPVVIWVIAIVGWYWGGSQWWYKEQYVNDLLVKADKAGKAKAAGKRAIISRRQNRDLHQARESGTDRAYKLKDADAAMDRYEGKTDAVVPSDVHGAIHKVR